MPDLCEAMIVLGMIGAGFKPQNSRVRFGRAFRSRMKKHFACLARPPDRRPFNFVEMTRLVGLVILSRRFARGRQFRICGRRIGNLLADSTHFALPFAVLSRSLFLPAILLHHSTTMA